jgi:hypothetical protein
MSLSVKYRGWLGYHAVSSPREEDIMSMPTLVGHRLEVLTLHGQSYSGFIKDPSVVTTKVFLSKQIQFSFS